MRNVVLPCLIAAVAASGCATKKYVGREVGEVNQKVDTLSTEVEKTQERVKRRPASPTPRARRTAPSCARRKRSGRRRASSSTP